MSLERLETRDHLILSLGYVLDPLRRVLFREPFVEMSRHDEIRFTKALDEDLEHWKEDLRTYANYKDLFYDKEFEYIINVLEQVCYSIKTKWTTLELDEIAVEQVRYSDLVGEAINGIRRIDVDLTDEIIHAQNPFRSYRLFRSLCSNASKRIEIFDAYLDDSVFHRYLSDLQPDVDVKLITDETIMVPSADKRNDLIRDRILAVSELLAQERSDHYWFLVVPSLHDRHLRVNDDLFHLGGSLKDAAKNDAFTLTTVDANDAIITTLDNFVSTARAWYEPGLARHRRWCPNCKLASDVHVNRKCVACSTPT
jgi:hypothetical protein